MFKGVGAGVARALGRGRELRGRMIVGSEISFGGVRFPALSGDEKEKGGRWMKNLIE